MAYFTLNLYSRYSLKWHSFIGFIRETFPMYFTVNTKLGFPWDTELWDHDVYSPINPCSSPLTSSISLCQVVIETILFH